MTCQMSRIVNARGGGFRALVRRYLEDHGKDLPDVFFDEENYEREVTDLTEELDAAVSDRWTEWKRDATARYAFRNVVETLSEEDPR